MRQINPGDSFLVPGGTCITPIYKRWVVVWVNEDTVWYSLEGERFIYSTPLSRFLEITAGCEGA